MTFRCTALVVFLIIFGTLSGVGAEEEKAKGKIEFNTLRVEGLVIGKKLTFGKQFAQKHNVEMKAPFEFTVPTEKGVKIFAAFPPDTGGEWTKISFATPDKKLIENLRFTGLTVPVGDEKQRLAILQDLLIKQGLPQALKQYANSKFLGARPVRIKDLPGVEVAAAFEDSEIGLMYVWMVGILKPGDKNGVMAMAQISPKLSEVKQPADLGKKGIAAKALSTFKFIEE